MPQEIIERVIGSVTDQRLKLTNGQAVRNLAVLDNWNVLRIGMQYSLDGAVTLAGTPLLAFGLHAGNSKGYGDADCVHFVGIISNAATWAYNAGTTGYYTGQNCTPAKKIATTVTTGTATGISPNVSAAPSIARGILILELTKGSPNFTIKTAGISNSTAGQTDVTDANFLLAMESGVLTDGNTNYAGISGLSVGFARTLAVDETADGLLDSLCVYYDKSSVPLEISAIRVKKIS